MDLNGKVTQLEDEIKVLKKEIQSVLLDLRENMLNRENPFSPMPLTAGSSAVAAPPPPPPPAEAKKEVPVDEKPKEPAAPGKKTEVPAAITGAFKTDEPVAFPKKKDKAAETPNAGGLVLAWKPADDAQKGTCLPGAKNTADKPAKNTLESVTNLVAWVEGSITRLGFERTNAILDISEMMGHLSPEMKNILVKFMHPGPEPVEKVAFKDYMASLIELAGLLGRKNDPNNVLFYTLYHGMYSMTESKEKNG